MAETRRRVRAFARRAWDSELLGMVVIFLVLLHGGAEEWEAMAVVAFLVVIISTQRKPTEVHLLIDREKLDQAIADREALAAEEAKAHG